jgi:hypothetical protein
MSKTDDEMNCSRRAAVEYALASAKLEGFNFTQDELAEFERLAKGEITTEQLRQKVFDKIKKMKVEHPEWFTQEKK